MLCDYCLLEKSMGPQNMRWVPAARHHQCSRMGCDRIFDEFSGYRHFLNPEKNQNLQKCTCIAARAMYLEQVNRLTYRYRCSITECPTKGPSVRDPRWK
jgi:hypothetical protein